jgi:hypothetical protein
MMKKVRTSETSYIPIRIHGVIYHKLRCIEALFQMLSTV